MVSADGELLRAAEKIQGHDQRPVGRKSKTGSKGKGQRKRKDERPHGTGKAGKRTGKYAKAG